AIGELSQAACAGLGLDGDEVATAVLAREAQGPTGLGDRIAVPHARLDSLDGPVVAVGLSRNGIDFDAPDGLPAQLVFLILTPRDDDGAQVEILADIARTFRHEEVRQKVVEVPTYTEFLAMIRTQSEVRK
ncbi:MAG: PTS sugar transporter subunit IIA, partial [Planctomycetota bacterium]